MLAGNRDLFSFRLRASRGATLRDVVVVALWIAFSSLFALDLWRSGPDAGARPESPAAEVRNVS